MTAVARLVVATVYCDNFGCLNTIVPPFDCSPCSDPLAVLLNDLGWSTWGGHGLHHYCPNHKPRKGHTMYPIDPPSDQKEWKP